MSILDSFGFERAEDLGDENGITAMPFDFQHKLKGWGRTWNSGLPRSPGGLLEFKEIPEQHMIEWKKS